MDLLAVQAELFDGARNIRASGDEIRPIVFMVTERNGLAMLPLSILPKERWRQAILQFIEQTNAIAIVIHSEAWAHYGNDVSKALSAKMAGIESTEEVPGAVEILQSTLETRDGLHRTITARIDENGKLGTETETRRLQNPTDDDLIGEMVRFFG